MNMIAEMINMTVQAQVSEYGKYTELIEHLEDRLAEMKKNDKPVKECSVLAGFALAVATAKNFARRTSDSEDEE